MKQANLPKDQIIEWRTRGLRNTEIICLLEGPPWLLSGVSSQSISAIARRAGLPRLQERYPEMFPWKIASEHRRLHHASMLRLHARVERGEVLKGRDKKYYDSWRRRMEHPVPLVLTYVENDPTGQGWYYLERTKEDQGLIRK